MPSVVSIYYRLEIFRHDPVIQSNRLLRTSQLTAHVLRHIFVRCKKKGATTAMQVQLQHYAHRSIYVTKLDLVVVLIYTGYWAW